MSVITESNQSGTKPMTPEEFYSKVMAHKLKAHTLFEGTGGYKVIRGMGHSIAGYVEDLFAVFIATNLCRSDLLFYVDKVISYRTSPFVKADSLKPDLLILNGNTAAHYYDLKTDIGYNRDMRGYLKDRNDTILSLRGQEAWITVNKKIEHRITFSHSIKYSVVVTMGWNVNPSILKTNIEYAKGLEGIEFYVLIDDNNSTNHLDANVDEFQRLLADCKSYLL